MDLYSEDYEDRRELDGVRTKKVPLCISLVLTSLI
jgi:hypothetical protein